MSPWTSGGVDAVLFRATVPPPDTEAYIEPLDSLPAPTESEDMLLEPPVAQRAGGRHRTQVASANSEMSSAE